MAPYRSWHCWHQRNASQWETDIRLTRSTYVSRTVPKQSWWRNGPPAAAHIVSESEWSDITIYSCLAYILYVIAVSTCWTVLPRTVEYHRITETYKIVEQLGLVTSTLLIHRSYMRLEFCVSCERLLFVVCNLIVIAGCWLLIESDRPSQWLLPLAEISLKFHQHMRDSVE